jgi:hypothetical protein
MVDQVVDGHPDDGDQPGHNPGPCDKPNYWPETYSVNLPTRDGQSIPIGATYEGVVGGSHVYALMVKLAPEDPPPPPTPITLDGTDCEGETLPATGLPGELVQVVQPPGQVFNVRFCEPQSDVETVTLCDPSNDHQIVFQYDMSTVPPTLLSAFDMMTGAVFTGDPATLEVCGNAAVESDPQEMCDNGVQFIRWFVMKKGVPTGVHYDTDKAGAAYTVTNEAAVTFGKCVAVEVCEPTISSAPGNALGTLLPGSSVSIQKSNCCVLKVTTSAGSFIVSKDVTGYSTGDFKCMVTVTAVEILSGACNLADVIVTTQFSG